ncbi:MAG: AN1-type zinc finger domain-containing protein [Promethearchaeota archaeon]
MANCAYCGKELYLGFTCKRCGKTFCSKHRLPENHNCDKLNLAKEDIAIKMQMEKNVKLKNLPETARVKVQEKTEPIHQNFDYDDDDYERTYSRSQPQLNHRMMYFVMFMLLTLDILTFASYGPNILHILPITIHLIFIPILFFIQRSKHTNLTPVERDILFLRILLVYFVFYFGSKLILAVFPRINFIDFFMALILGIFFIYSISKTLKQFELQYTE